uniref:Uncharacterized protein n=1 Tax=Panagrolaimus sp. ES5 TaxID=591445 RepID=A0AC34FSJ3_9BILA
MLFKTTLIKNSKLSFNSKTTINFNENLEFSLTPQNSGNTNYIFQAHDFKGDFEIAAIYCSNHVVIPYDKETKTFITVGNYANNEYQFTILTDIEYKKVAYQYVPYQLYFPLTRLRLLKLFEYYEEYFTIPGYEQIEV